MWDKWREQELGLFKLEFEGIHGIVLCSKCYFMEDETGKAKASSKGSSKSQNKLKWKRYKAALEGGLDTVTNRGISIRKNSAVMCTFEQKNKRWGLLDGIHNRKSMKRWQLSVGSNDKRLSVHEAMFWPIMQITQRQFFGFGDRFFNVEDFKRPDWICGSFSSAFQLTGLLATPHNCIGGEPFSFKCGARNAIWSEKINFPKGLLGQPLFCSTLRNFFPAATWPEFFAGFVSFTSVVTAGSQPQCSTRLPTVDDNL